ncbi:MAG: hypothetical protein GWP91_08465 [Rhodobacterales bacterium]|nr:hypothetical protein [Rhodobacterales bacterium]
MYRILPLVLVLGGCTNSFDLAEETSPATYSGTSNTGTTGTATGTTAGTPSGTNTNPQGGSAQRVLGYFPAWGVYGRDYHIADVPAEQLTHLIYAFANIGGGTCVLGDPYADIDRYYPGDSWDVGTLRGSFNQMAQLKADHPHLNTVLSVGGWTWSQGFSDAAATPESRQAFATGCVDMVRSYGFDGLSVDWEYPVEGGLYPGRPEDGANDTLLMQAVRDELDAYESIDGVTYELSIAASGNPAIAAHMELSSLAGIIDWYDLMTYDFRGSWSSKTGLQAPLYAHPGDPMEGASDFNVHAAVQLYLAGGVAPDQLVVGVPFYGRGWPGVAATNDGLFQDVSGIPQGTWEPAAYDYADIVANYETPATVFWDEDSKSSWIYDVTTGIMISYDSVEAVEEKAAYVEENALGGIMFWELSADAQTDSLLDAVHRGFARSNP